MTKAQKADMEEAREDLRKRLKPGQEVLCILRHCSRSGMQRVIDLAIVETDDMGTADVRRIGWTAARALGDRYDRKREGIVVGGCGMDMGFHIVYSLGSVLWPHGTPQPHGRRNGQPDSDGGYALRSRWL